MAVSEVLGKPKLSPTWPRRHKALAILFTIDIDFAYYTTYICINSYIYIYMLYTKIDYSIKCIVYYILYLLYIILYILFILCFIYIHIIYNINIYIYILQIIYIIYIIYMICFLIYLYFIYYIY